MSTGNSLGEIIDDGGLLGLPANDSFSGVEGPRALADLSLTETVAEATFQEISRNALEVGGEIARLDHDLALYETSYGTPLVAPLNLAEHPTEWPEAQALREHTYASELHVDTLLVSPLIEVTGDISLDGTDGRITFNRLQTAISKALRASSMHDFGSVKATLLANTRRPEPEEFFDVVVILGIAPDADRPTELNETGRSRALAALSLFHSGLSAPLVLSGGAVTSPAELPEAKMLEDYLQRYFVPSLSQSTEPVMREEMSRTTLQNFAFVVPDLLEQHGFRTPLVITSDYHVDRSREIAEWVGGEKYDFRFFGAPSQHLPAETVRRIEHGESLGIAALKKALFPRVESGDVQRIQSLILKL